MGGGNGCRWFLIILYCIKPTAYLELFAEGKKKRRKVQFEIGKKIRYWIITMWGVEIDYHAWLGGEGNIKSFTVEIQL